MHTQIEIYGYNDNLLGVFNKNTVGSLYHNEDNDTVKCFIFNEGDICFENVYRVKSVTYVTPEEQKEIDEKNRRTLEESQVMLNNMRNGINPFGQMMFNNVGNTTNQFGQLHTPNIPFGY